MSTLEPQRLFGLPDSHDAYPANNSQPAIEVSQRSMPGIKPLQLPRLTVRKAQDQDLTAIVSMNSQMSSELDKKTLNPFCVKRKVRRQLVDPREGTYFVASLDGFTVGMLRIWPEPYDWDGRDVWWIDNVFTANRVRKQGVGTALMRHVMDVAKKDDNVETLRLHVHIHNFNAIGFYLKFGFEIRDLMLSQSI